MSNASNERLALATIHHGYANPNGHGSIIWTEFQGVHHVLSEPDEEDEAGELFYAYETAAQYFAERVDFWSAIPADDWGAAGIADNYTQPEVEDYVPNATASWPSPASNWR